MTAARRDVSALFEPHSVAVVGASADPAKWGYWLTQGALVGEQVRPVFLVSRRGEDVLGRPTYSSLHDLPEVPDLVVVSVPPAGFEEVVDAAVGLGSRAVVAVTAGVDAEVISRVGARVRAAGAVLLGPNCMGVADTTSHLRLVWGEVPSGRIGLLSQSGNLAIELGKLASHDGLGFSRFVSLGNEADLTAADLLETVAQDPNTDVVALYLEDFRRLRELAEAADRVRRSGTGVVLLAAGRSAVGQRAAASHTGAMAGSRAAIHAACRAAGIAVVQTPAELLEVAHALSAGARPVGHRVGIVGDGGGHGVVAADLLVDAGLQVPRFTDALSAALVASLPPVAVGENPVDLAGGGEQDLANYARTLGAILRSGEADAALLTGYFGAYGQDEPRLADREAVVAEAVGAVVAETGRPVVVHSVAPDGATAAVLRGHGVPVLRRVEGATAGLAALAAARDARGVPPLPEPAPHVPSGDAYLTARDLLRDARVVFPEARPVGSADEAVAAAESIGYPVVVKALGLAHKSDVGGVHLGLGDAEAVRRAHDDVAHRLGAGVVVEQMVLERGVELIVGARWDASAGPLVMVGLGGVQAEVWGDVAVALAPVDHDDALVMLRSLRGARLLTGFRGVPPVDLAAVASAVVAVATQLAAHPELAALEVNPLLATPSAAWALDAHLELGEESSDEGSGR